MKIQNKFVNKHVLTRVAALFMAMCLAFTMVSIAAPSVASAAPETGEVAAKASGTLKVNSLKWAKSSLDTTLIAKNAYLQAKLTVKVKNSMAGSNCVAVTIQNTKTKVKMTEHANKNGGSVYFMLQPTKKHIGTWKVISVSAAKRTQKNVGVRPGYWDPWGKWNPPTNIISTKYKNLKTVKVSKPNLKVTRGAETKLTITSPKTILSSEKTIPLTATLKDAKGKAVVGKTVKFQVNVDGATKNDKPIIVSAKTNKKGVAKVNAKFKTVKHASDEYRALSVVAYFTGQAKKYCISESKSIKVKVPKPKTEFSVAPVWDGHTGQKTFTTKVVYSEGPTKGQPVAGVPIVWTFDEVGRTGGYIQNETVNTDAQGVSSFTWTLGSGDWKDYDVNVSEQIRNRLDAPYAAPTAKTYRLTKQQGVINYTIDTSKLQLMAGSTGDGGNWFSAAASSRNNLTVTSAQNILVDSSGKPLPQIGIIDSSSNKLICSIKSTAGGNVGKYLIQNKAVEFSLNGTNSIPNKASNRFTGISGFTTTTQVEITLTLPEFANNLYPEYKFVPIAKTVTKRLS